MYLEMIILVIATSIATFFIIRKKYADARTRPCAMKKRYVQNDVVIGNTSSTNSQYIRGSWRDDASDNPIGSCGECYDTFWSKNATFSPYTTLE